MKNRGFIQTIVTIIISLVILSIVGIDLEERFKSPLLKKNLEFTWKLIGTGWNYAWNSLENVINPKSATTTISTSFNLK